MDVRTALFGPRIYALLDVVPKLYPSNLFESAGDTLLSALHIAYSLATGVSPVIAYYMFSRGLFNAPTLFYLTKSVGLYIIVALSLRTAGLDFAFREVFPRTFD